MKLAGFERKFRTIVAFAFLLAISLYGQDAPQTPSGAAKSPVAAPDYSGMYAFLREGEFVQLNPEDGKLTGFISRYGDSESDRGVFLDQFFKQGKIDGNKIRFTTAVVHGISYDFKGSIERGEGKNPGDEAYYVLKGTLTQNTAGEGKNTTSKSRDVALKSFPREMAPPE